MLKNPHVKTVVNKTEKIDNVFRNAQLEVIAGENNFIAIVKEGNARFTLDYSEVYWNSNNHTDREAVLSMISYGQSLCDMFCGVGPLSVQAAKKQAYVTANDLNPACYKYLKVNTINNKITSRLFPFCMDAREFFIAISRWPK